MWHPDTKHCGVLLLLLWRGSCFLIDARLRQPATTLRSSSTLSEQEIASLLAGSEYTVDISSIALDSEKETYIGRGTGVNEGKTFFLSVVLRREDSIAGMGLGALATWTRELVGKVLTWKNQPVYDELWKIIEDDCLAMCRDKEPQLVAAETWFEPSRPEPYSFASSDGKCDGMVAGYRGGNIDWLTTCKFFSKQLGFGGMRIDGWLDRTTRAPHLAVHLNVIFNVIFIYINLVPRSNLILDDGYNDYVYGMPKPAAQGRSLNDIHNECIEDKRNFEPYFPKSHLIKAFMNSPTPLLYTVKVSKKNLEKVRQISMDYTRAWLDMKSETSGVLVKDVDSKDIQAELLKTDVRTRQFCGRDPDTKNVAKMFGFEATRKIVKTLCGHPADPIWASR